MARFGMMIVVSMAMGCSDYSLIGKGKDVEPAPPDDGLGEQPAPEEPPAEQPEIAPSCDGVFFGGWSWAASATFQGETDPVDDIGRPFWDPDATLAWAPISVPDRNVPTGDDRAYVARFDLDEVPLNLSLNLQSDDGLWVWVNGTYLGNWGGDWQEEGCVNESAECLVTIDVPPVDITDLLVVGGNNISARLSNPVANAYFEIIPECVAP